MRWPRPGGRSHSSFFHLRFVVVLLLSTSSAAEGTHIVDYFDDDGTGDDAVRHRARGVCVCFLTQAPRRARKKKLRREGRVFEENSSPNSGSCTPFLYRRKKDAINYFFITGKLSLLARSLFTLRFERRKNETFR